jgi:hypothetical protein
MPWPHAIGVTLALLILGFWGPGILMILIIVGTAAWAAYDSKQIGLQRYKSGISLSPLALFVALILLWIAGFPWYLIVRGHIKTGAAVLKEPTTLETGGSN